MTPPRTPKLSGAELAAQLAGTSFATPPPATPAPSPPTPDPDPIVEPEPPQERKTQVTKAAARPKGGRPAKAGVIGDALPVNVRLSIDDHSKLLKAAALMAVPGRPMPTVQDIVRKLVRGATKNGDETLMKLIRKGDD